MYITLEQAYNMSVEEALTQVEIMASDIIFELVYKHEEGSEFNQNVYDSALSALSIRRIMWALNDKAFENLKKAIEQ